MAVSSTSVKLEAAIKGSTECNFLQFSHWCQTKAANGAVPDNFSDSAAFSACEKGGRWQSALDLLSLMLRAKVVHDTIFIEQPRMQVKKAFNGS